MLERKNSVLNPFIISILLYGSECWVISPKMKEIIEAKRMKKNLEANSKIETKKDI